MSGLSETVLWTNPSPYSTFDEQTITLSDYVTNYEYIKIDYNYNYRADYDSNYTPCSDIFPVSQLFTIVGHSGVKPITYGFHIGCGIHLSTNTLGDGGYHRPFRFPVSEGNKIDFGKVYSGTSGNTQYIIPQKVYGLK